MVNHKEDFNQNCIFLRATSYDGGRYLLLVERGVSGGGGGDGWLKNERREQRTCSSRKWERVCNVNREISGF